MSSKRSHSKSRRGCSQCKSRHIKCDEAPPCCGNCIKKGLKCDYEELRPAIERIKIFTPMSFDTNHTTPSTQGTSRDTSTRSPSPPQSTFTVEDLGLLHHFTLYTSQSLPPVDSEQYRYIWQHDVPRLAQSHDFLMHAILGFAAAHQSSECRNENRARQLKAAREHYSMALNLFQQSVVELTAEKADALLCFCILTSILSLHFESDKPDEERDSIGEFANFLHVLHTSTGVLSSVQGFLQESRIGSLLQHTRTQQKHDIPQHISCSLDRLNQAALEYWKDTPDRFQADIIIDAIVKLRRLFTLLDPMPSSWAYLLSWPITLDPGFSRLLNQRNAVALSVLAHWCVPAYNAPSKWYTGDWPRRLTFSVFDELNRAQYIECIEWPLSETIGIEKLGIS